jgi:hypothetical protein
MEASSNREPVDWDAAWATLVEQLRPSLGVRIARGAGQTVATLVVLAATAWMLVVFVFEPATRLGRPGM